MKSTRKKRALPSELQIAFRKWQQARFEVLMNDAQLLWRKEIDVQQLCVRNGLLDPSGLRGMAQELRKMADGLERFALLRVAEEHIYRMFTPRIDAEFEEDES